MAIANGFGKVVTSGSVFMYDTGDFYNSYKGQPGTNITTGVGRNYDGYNRTTYETNIFLETNGYTEVVNIPALGPTTVQSIEINNSAPGPACCPNLYNYTGGWMSPIWLPGQTYSYQIIYKVRSGYTNPNFMYHYEYTNTNDYLTEYGVFTTEKQESLGDGWYHAWNTFTTHPFAAKGYTGLWYYQYYVADKLSIAAVNISPGDTIRPPQQIIPSGTTRSATQGLLPLVGNSTINLSNVSFDSNAQIVFDGTDDYIITGNMPAMSNWTAETIINLTNYTTSQKVILDVNLGIRFEINNGRFNSHFGDGSGWIYTNLPSSFTYTANKYYHVVITVQSGGSATMYINGELNNTTSIGSGTTPSVPMYIGRFTGTSGYEITGYLPIVKIYNRALSAAEVKQNYNKYKSRFNLS
jgi:hypothetical protein